MADPRRIMRNVAIYFVLTWGTCIYLAWTWKPFAAVVVFALLVFTLLVLITFLRNRGWTFYPGVWFRLLVIRSFWYVQLIVPVVAIAGFVGLAMGAPYGLALWLGRELAITALCGIVLFLIIGYIGSRALRVREVIATIPGLPERFDGYRITQLSDLHVGPHISRRRMSRIAEITNKIDADMIAVTGDLVDDRIEDTDIYATYFGGLHARDGVFVVPGNHDVYAGWEGVRERLRAIDGLTVLVNERRTIQRGEHAIVIAGTGDPAMGFDGDNSAAPDVIRMLSGLPRYSTVIALAHNPALWKQLAAKKVALTLSGHTHWGQFAIPRAAWSLATPFLEHAMGPYKAGSSLLYVQAGTGYWGVPFRLGAVAEITIVTLKRGDVAAMVARNARIRIPAGPKKDGTVVEQPAG